MFPNINKDYVTKTQKWRRHNNYFRRTQEKVRVGTLKYINICVKFGDNDTVF